MAAAKHVSKKRVQCFAPPWKTSLVCHDVERCSQQLPDWVLGTESQQKVTQKMLGKKKQGGVVLPTGICFFLVWD